MADSELDTRIRVAPVAPGSTVLVCIWLAAMASCDAVKSEQKRHEYQHTLVMELCTPGAFYRECWWEVGDELCHEAMANLVAASMPTARKRIEPSEALREHVLERVYFHHTTIVAASTIVFDFSNEACWDGTPWNHLPAGKEYRMTRVRARVEERRRARREAPTTTDVAPDTAPVPSPGTAPEPSPGPEPAPAPAL